MKVYKKIEFTYLLGAGASASIIPTVKDFPLKLAQFAIEFQNIIKEIDLNNLKSRFSYINEDVNDELNQLRRDFQWLEKESRAHASVDTFAKKLYLTNSHKLYKKVKALLDIFFTIIQLVEGVDKRYDAFYATLLKKGERGEVKLPENISILCWNYDFQLELSFNTFYNRDDIHDLENYLNIIPRNDFNQRSANNFSVVKLNGVASGYVYENDKFNRLLLLPKKISANVREEKKQLLIEMIGRYLWYTKYSHDNASSSIFYSWENDQIQSEIRETAKEITKNTKILIIIGYSFPTFNRMMDKEIILNMPELEKVYLQIPEHNIKSVAQRFRAINPNVELVMLTEVDEFFIPFEYNL